MKTNQMAVKAAEYEIITLPSGLTVQVRPMPGYSSVHAVYGTDFGSIDRFFTVDGKGEPLNMTAENAYELPGETRRIRLNNVKADLVLKDNRFLALDAAAAVYFQSKDTVELSESVNLYSEDGFELNTTQAQIGLKDQNLKGTAETFIRTPAGTAVSDGFEITDGGTIVRLTGKTKVVFYPNRKDEE